VITAIYSLHLLVSMALIVIVLLQTGKGADMGAAFGGASQTVFGSTGRKTFLTRLTAGAAVVFMITCLFLAWYSSQGVSKGVMKDFSESPAAPGAPAGATAPAPLPGTEAAPAPATGEVTPAPSEGQAAPAPAPTPAPESPPAPAPPSAPPAP